ncbi:MAG: hypothetical protein AUI36_22250 [Cyanobacteria bacterium 13_1_40CM_2_61_4]|nr:MAG: hypothetical protein AUI36_22250 [Cyanobacteria bacterium 13_1_40CM_2_61_4]
MALRGLLYRTVIGSSMADALRAALATKALSHTITMASLRAVFTETTPWRRTDKFPARPSPRRALRSAAVETALAVVSLGVALLAWVLVPEPGLLLMLAIGAVLQSGRYFSAALLALGSEWDLARRERAPTRLSVLDRLASRVTARGRRLPVRLGKVILAATATVAVVGAVILVMRLAAFSLHPTQGLTAQPPASRPASPHDLSTSGIGVGSGSSGKSLVAALSGRGPGSSHQEAGSRRSGFGGPPDSIPKPPPHPGPVPVPPGSPRPPGSPPHRGTPGQQGQPPGQ